MKSLSEKAQRLFKEAGRQGGQRRAQSLSAARRKDIAVAAAEARWKGANSNADASLPSVRLNQSRLSDPVYLEEILSFGTLADWRRLRRCLEDRPFGPEATALEKVCRFSSLYGAIPLWTNILRSLQGGYRP